MIALGRIPIRSQASINEARQKILQVVEVLSRDAITATRLVTATSEMCRLLYGRATAPQIALEINTAARPPALVLVFEDQQPLPATDLLNPFFDHIEPIRSSNGLYTVRASKRLPQLRLEPGIIDQLKAVIGRKSRDELMIELQQTLAGLEQRVVERTLELEKANEQIEEANERMQGELNIGRDIQMSLLPLDFPAFPDRNEFNIYATLQPAREVGGDFYDFFFIDEDRLCFCIGDVSGKGVPAALFMAVTKTLIKSRATNDLSTASILTHVNDELSRDNKASMFVTIFLSILDLKTGDLVYTNAGHNPPYIKRHDSSLVRLDSYHGPVVGAMSGMTYNEDKTVLSKGDFLLKYTDGVTEAMDVEHNLFSEKRLVEVLSSRRCRSVEEFVQATVSEVKHFEGEADQADDITVLAIQFLGQAEEVATQILEMTIKNSFPEIDRLNQQVSAFADQYGIPKMVSRRLNLVFDELLNNIMTYAYGDDNDHDIEIKVELFGDRLAIMIADDGLPFNPFGAETPNTKLSVEERGIGGLGIHLVRNMMNKVAYQRRIDKNVVSLVKYLNTGVGTHENNK